MDMRVIIIDPRAFFLDGSFRIWISVSGPYGPKFSLSKQNPLLVLAAPHRPFLFFNFILFIEPVRPLFSKLNVMC